MALGSLGVAAYGARQQAKAAQATAATNTAYIAEDLQTTLADTRTAHTQIAADAASEESARVRAAREEAASIATIAGEYGDGNNTLRLQNDAAQDAALDVGNIQLNRGRQLTEVSKDAEQARKAASRGIANEQSRARTSRRGAYLGLAGTALSIGAQYNASRPK
jgi:hypothetical protein